MPAAWQAHLAPRGPDACTSSSAILLLSLCLGIFNKSISLFLWSLWAMMPFLLLQRRSLLISFCSKEQTEEITNKSSCGLK